MVIVELIGSISLAVALIGVVALGISYIKNKQNDVTHDRDRSLNRIRQLDRTTNHLQEENNRSIPTLPFQEIDKDLSINFVLRDNPSKELSTISVINNDKISLLPINHDTQCILPSNDHVRAEIIDSPSNIVKGSEFEQDNSLPYNGQTISVRHLVEKFENNSARKIYRTEKNNQTDSNIATYSDGQAAKINVNENQKTSSPPTILDLDATILSDLSSSIDLE